MEEIHYIIITISLLFLFILIFFFLVMFFENTLKEKIYGIKIFHLYK